ncbi:MAG: hypothetical protein WAM97_11425 [Acidimicrobiales bacterium]|jgi:uncharacterized membrane protein
MTSEVLLALAVFGACTVESVEALTLVLAAGTTQGWRSAYEGAASALVVLAILVGAIGFPLVHYVPINVIRVIIGALLLVLGLGWLRKAVLRASGHKALHDEDKIYANTVAELSTGTKSSGRSTVGFSVAFKGVLLEGMEVVLIVLSLGATSHHLALASVMAVAAAAVVVIVGALVARQLREVPENALKFGVGVMLTSFGVFWVGEGSGFRWPGADAAVLVLIAAYLLLAVALVRWLRVRVAVPVSSGGGESAAENPGSRLERAVRSFAHFIVDLLIGDTPEAFIGTLLIVGVALLLRHERWVAMPVVLVLAAVVLATGAYRGSRGSYIGKGLKSS